MAAPRSRHPEAINQELAFFAAQMARLRAAGAIPVGYVDRPGSAYVLRILELIGRPIEEITARRCATGTSFSSQTGNCSLTWRPTSARAVEPNSDTNDRYRVRSGRPHRLCVRQLPRQPGRANAAIARIEVPGWIASDPAMLDLAQAAIYANCDPTRYPYVLAHAHELAVVGGAEKEGWSKCCSRSCCAAG